jgi:hypothetical protein
VQIRTAAAAERKISGVKQIQPACERRFWPARAFGHGGDSPQFRRQPVDDQAGFRERTRAQDDAMCGFNHFKIIFILILNFDL